MKKASKILFLIGGILSIVLAVLWLSLGSVFLAAAASLKAGEPFDFAMELYKSIAADNPGYSPEQIVSLIVAVGVVFFVLFVFAIPAAVLSFICKGKDYRGLPLLIVSTAICIFGGTYVSVVGGVLGIVNWAVFERKEQAQKAE